MLDRKLLRDLAKMKGQATTIALVVASGIAGFIAMLSTYDSLQWSRSVYYDAARFAHVFADLKRAPESLSERIARLPGVADAETTVVFDATLDVPRAAEPVIGRMIGLTRGEAPRLNRLSLRRGRWPKQGERSEVLVSEGFANARELKPGDQVAAILNGNRETLRIVGVVLSPEYVYANRGGALPDNRGFGVSGSIGTALRRPTTWKGHSITPYCGSLSEHPRTRSSTPSTVFWRLTADSVPSVGTRKIQIASSIRRSINKR